MAAVQVTAAEVGETSCAAVPVGAAGAMTSAPAVTVICAVATLSAASWAVTVIVCGPGAVGTAQFWTQGAAVALPSGEPSTSKSTRVTPPSSVASAVIGIVPATMAPSAGAVSTTVGRWVSTATHGCPGSPMALALEPSA